MIDTGMLKAKAISLAMSGKLTEQLRDDGIAIPDGYRLSNVDEAEMAYPIPNSWKWVRVRDVVLNDVGGGTPRKTIPEYWDNGIIPWATVKDFSGAANGRLIDTIDHITEEGLKNSSANLVDEQAIVICMRMALGKIVRVDKPMAINQDLRAIWLHPFINEDYFVYYYSSLKVVGRGMTVLGIRKDELMNFTIPIPPLPEQERIVELLNKICESLDIIDKLQSAYSSDLEVLKSKIIDAGIQGKLTEQLPEDGNAKDLYEAIQEEKQKLIKKKKLKKTKTLPKITEDEIPFEIPENWKWVRIGDVIAKDLGGGTPSKTIPEYWQNGAIPWATVKDFSSSKNGFLSDTINHITEEGLINSSANIVDQQAIIICMRMALGKIARVSVPMAINQDLRGIWLNDMMLTEFFVYFYSTLTIEGRGTTVAGIRKEELMNILLPLPPLNEQKRIVEKLDNIISVML